MASGWIAICTVKLLHGHKMTAETVSVETASQHSNSYENTCTHRPGHLILLPQQQRAGRRCARLLPQQWHVCSATLPLQQWLLLRPSAPLPESLCRRPGGPYSLLPKKQWHYCDGTLPHTCKSHSHGQPQLPRFRLDPSLLLNDLRTDIRAKGSRTFHDGGLLSHRSWVCAPHVLLAVSVRIAFR